VGERPFAKKGHPVAGFGTNIWGRDSKNGQPKITKNGKPLTKTTEKCPKTTEALLPRKNPSLRRTEKKEKKKKNLRGLLGSKDPNVRPPAHEGGGGQGKKKRKTDQSGEKQ